MRDSHSSYVFRLTLRAEPCYCSEREFAVLACGYIMPLCLAGMHRSGTSLIASLLHSCGLDLGPQNDLLPPAPNNPIGFWESRSFLRLNDALLKELGGSWDNPPPADVAGWESEPRLHPLRKRAEKLVTRFEGREAWGWKDPRNCLTLPLWRELLPEMNILICVRNPLAVAESLWLRDGISSPHSLALWLTYNRRVLAAAPVAHRLVIHCETLLHNPHAELRRVLGWAGIATTHDQVKRACQLITPSLLHHRMTLDDLMQAGVSDELMACYLDLCGEAILHRDSAGRPGRKNIAKSFSHR